MTTGAINKQSERVRLAPTGHDRVALGSRIGYRRHPHRFGEPKYDTFYLRPRNVSIARRHSPSVLRRSSPCVDDESHDRDRLPSRTSDANLSTTFGGYFQTFRSGRRESSRNSHARIHADFGPLSLDTALRLHFLHSSLSLVLPLSSLSPSSSIRRPDLSSSRHRD